MKYANEFKLRRRTITALSQNCSINKCDEREAMRYLCIIISFTLKLLLLFKLSDEFPKILYRPLELFVYLIYL